MRLGGYSARMAPIVVALVVGIALGVAVVAPLLGSGQAAAVAVATVDDSGSSANPGEPGSSAGSSADGSQSAAPAGTRKPSAAPASRVPAVAVSAAAEGVVPILYYHRVEGLPAGFSRWSKRSQDQFLVDDTLPAAFSAQLDWLVAHGYTTILPRDLAGHWDKGTRLPKRPIILTFDDGFSDWRSYVMPQLLKRGMVAEFYVTIANVGRSISWTDVRALAKAGMGIGAHDVHHFQLAGGGVATASIATMRYQVTEAKRLIELNARVTVDSMAYVGGGYNATLIRIAQEAGYTTARAIERGVRQAPEARYHLQVSRVGWRDDVLDMYSGRLAKGLPTFAARVSGQNPG